MRKIRLTWKPLHLLLFTLLAGLITAQAQLKPDRLKGHVLVVFNSANTDSETLAHYYAKLRSISADHVLGIQTPDSEEITRDEYNNQIRDPIDTYIVSKGWLEREPGHSPFGDQQLPVMAARKNDIWIIVLIYGIPLKIANDPKANDLIVSNAALNTNAAAVDSELTLLPYQGLPITGFLPNPFELIDYDRPFDGLDAKHMMLVTRLDGPTADDVRRMIDDSIYAEKTRLVGDVHIDTRGITDESQGYFQGDNWLRQSAKLLVKNGWSVDVDEKPEQFPANLPWTNVAMYAGWYGTNANGPFMRASPTFSRGAIAYPIHSFSASTLRSTTSNWCGPLISKGVSATMGAVYEPYLDFMPQWNIVVDRLLRGYTFAEAAYSSQKALSWMVTFIGDPLYTPFALDLQQATELAPDTPSSVRHDFLLIQQARMALVQGDLTNAKILAEKAIGGTKSSFVAWEGYAEIMSDPRLEPPNSTVAEAYERAFNLSMTIEDQMRTALKCAQAYENRFRPQDSIRILSLMYTRYPNESVTYGVEAYLKRLRGNTLQKDSSFQPAVNDNDSSMKPSIDTPSINSTSLKN